ncbi:nuclear RNA export factor 3-like isoform X2 [Bos javanicus]|uniref:nuclear RNA export factor 3-like isoform X2 n=1 Tax=Bos javanicus TaxID=9906 RepID=UPI002AA877D8|nr:nuclear RNA export factor 3-like isoform X2 [Bos javanicus]
MEHTDKVKSLQRRAQSSGIYRRQYACWSEPVTSQQQEDRDSKESDAHMVIQGRYAPYAIPSHHWRSSFQRKDQMHVNMESDQKPPERTMKTNRQDETLGSWFKIIIPFDIKYDEKWLMNLIQKKCSVPFTAVEFHYEKMQAQFFVENANVACALKNVSGKIFNEDNEKISIFVEPCDAPQSVQKTLTSEKLEQIKLTMNKPYDACQQALDIQRLRFGPGMATVVTAGQFPGYLITRGIGMTWNRRNSMAASLHVYPGIRPMLSSLYLSNKKPYLVHGLSTIMEISSTMENLNLSNTEVKIAGEMDKGHQLEPEGMCADRSAVCTTFRDKSTNMSTLLELFPRLLSLDGQETLSGSKCAVEAPKCLPMYKGSFFGSDQVNSQILQFLQHYYLIHDYGDRQGLLGFYHEEACFFLTIPFHSKDSGLSSMCAYFLDNRNMKTLKDPNPRVQMMKHTKHDIVRALCALPKTQHDFSSFEVDMCFHTETMFCFSVSGVFKEVEGISQGCVCAFTRTFTTTPTSSSSFCIVNDELFVREASPSEAQRLHSPSLCQPPSWSSSPPSSRK